MVINLVPLVGLGAELQMVAREIRNEENNRRWMFSDHIIEEEEHRAWIEHLKQDDKRIVFGILEAESRLLGIVGLTSINRVHRNAEWTFYLTETALGLRLGPAVEYRFVDFVFERLGLEKLNCEVIEGNDPVVDLHKRFLFQEEGFKRSNIFKNGQRKGVHFLGLTKEEGLAG